MDMSKFVFGLDKEYAEHIETSKATGISLEEYLLFNGIGFSRFKDAVRNNESDITQCVVAE